MNEYTAQEAAIWTIRKEEEKKDQIGLTSYLEGRSISKHLCLIFYENQPAVAVPLEDGITCKAC